jgi:hypothetical protein
MIDQFFPAAPSLGADHEAAPIAEKINSTCDIRLVEKGFDPGKRFAWEDRDITSGK